MNDNAERRKIDWVRIITAYSIPLVLLIGVLFVSQYRLADAEDEIDKKVDKGIHTEQHKAVDVRFDTVEQKIVKINERIATVNWQAQQRHDIALRTILKAVNDK